MKQLYKLSLLLISVFSCSGECFSQESVVHKSPLKLLISGGLDVGGDKIAEVVFTNGNKQGVRAGQGISLGVGGQLQIPGVEKFLLRSTIGLKYVTTAADNAHIRLTRIPFVTTGNFMATRRLRLSAGFSMHNSVRFKSDGLGEDFNLKSTDGPIFEIAYSGIGLSYTAMSYRDASNHSYSANAIGLTFSLTIPKN